MEKKLTPRTVFLGKSAKRGTKQRSGFADDAGQVFLPPTSPKRMTAWQKKMAERGYTF